MDRDMQKVPLFSHNHKLGRTTIAKTVSLIGHALEIVIGVTYNFSPCVPPNQRACTSCAILALYPLSFNICIGTFRAFSLSGAPASCSRHFQIKCAEIFGVHFFFLKKKNSLKSSYNACTRSSPSSKSFSEFMSSSNSFAQGVAKNVSFPCRQHLLVAQVDTVILLCRSYGPALASESELHCNWHSSKLSMHDFDRDMLLVRLFVPISPRHCKEPLRLFILA